MPFLLYERTRSHEETTKYVLLKEVSLAGTSTGLIYPFVKRYAPPGRAFPWHATVKDLLEESGIPSKGRAVLADLKPLLAGNLSLFEVTDIFGYSYREWTPIALRLETLFIEQTVPDRDRAKLRFSLRDRPRKAVHQFLYLQGGLEGGSWMWGPVGSVNGALLWPDALAFFLKRLGESLERRGRGTS